MRFSLVRWIRVRKPNMFAQSNGRLQVWASVKTGPTHPFLLSAPCVSNANSTAVFRFEPWNFRFALQCQCCTQFCNFFLVWGRGSASTSKSCTHLSSPMRWLIRSSGMARSFEQSQHEGNITRGPLGQEFKGWIIYTGVYNVFSRPFPDSIWYIYNRNPSKKETGVKHGVR
jgi:hypothetical protein